VSYHYHNNKLNCHQKRTVRIKNEQFINDIEL